MVCKQQKDGGFILKSSVPVRDSINLVEPVGRATECVSSTNDLYTNKKTSVRENPVLNDLQFLRFPTFLMSLQSRK